MYPVIRTATELLASLMVCMASVRAAEPSARVPLRLPDGTELYRVDFDRHVAPLFGRLGCNAGSCHGSFQGRGGLRLSLFGHDPAGDYEAIVRQGMGRRVDTLDPDRSLVLLKPSGRVPHEGGRRFLPDSWEYRVIRAWIASGARRDSSLAAAERIEARPRALSIGRPGQSARLAIVAIFADGTESDVTLFCDVHVKDDAVAALGSAGSIRGLRPGDTAVVASYHGLLAAARASVASGRTVAVPDVPESDYIDREVYAKLRTLGITPSGPSSDAEFLRRVSLDAIGTLPSPDDVRRFLADRAPDKRAREIDRLLAHPKHSALWATRFLGITGQGGASMAAQDAMEAARTRMAHDWFRRRIAENMPYDQIARGILCATSRDGEEVGRWLGARPRGWTRREGGARPTTHPSRAWTCSGRSSPPTAGPCRSRTWPSARPPRSWECGSSAPSATSTRSTAGPRPIIAPTPTSSPGSATASRPTDWRRRRGSWTSGGGRRPMAPCRRCPGCARSIWPTDPRAVSPIRRPAARCRPGRWAGPSSRTTATPAGGSSPG